MSAVRLPLAPARGADETPIRDEKKPVYGNPTSHLIRPSRMLPLGQAPPSQPALFRADEPRLRLVIKGHRATNPHADYRIEGSTPCSRSCRGVTQASIRGGRPASARCRTTIPPTRWASGASQTAPTVRAGLLAGRLESAFEGRRSRGAFRLETADRGRRLAKMRDEHAAVQAEPWYDRSIVTGRSLDGLERDHQTQMRRLRGR